MEACGRSRKKFLVFLRLVFSIFVGTDVGLAIFVAMECGVVQLNIWPLSQIFERLIVHFSINIKNDNSSLCLKKRSREK